MDKLDIAKFIVKAVASQTTTLLLTLHDSKIKNETPWSEATNDWIRTMTL